MLTDQDVAKLKQVFTTKTDLQKAVDEIIKYISFFSSNNDEQLTDHENRLKTLEKEVLSA